MDGQLQDYADASAEKLRVYDELVHLFPGDLHLYNVELAMPDVRGKVILEVPCGDGAYVRKYFAQKAAKVIATDIVPLQVEVAKQKDKEAGIPDGFAEYYVHDSRVPKQLSATLADMCSCVHLFCFSENEDQIRGVARMLNVNLKPGGFCAIVICSVCDSVEKYRKGLEFSEEKLVHLDPPSTEKFKVRGLHTTFRGFHFIRNIWPHDLVSEILRQEGFSRTEIVPYKFDSRFGKSPEDMQYYIDATDRKMILAWKD